VRCKTCGEPINGPVLETITNEGTIIDIGKAGYCRLGCLKPVVEAAIKIAYQRQKLN
jgi:hypothetical protein